MSKRMRTSLTGGTGDVNPQTLTLNVAESAANTFTEAEFSIPVMRGAISSTRYQVMELLKVEADVPPGDGATASGVNMQVTTSTQTGFQGYTNPDVVWQYRDSIVITTSGLTRHVRVRIYDYTDGAGHGMIIASPSLFIGVVGTSQGAALSGSVRLHYRFKNIGIQEFVGLAIQHA